MVSHDQGDEIGTIYSINYKTGKAVIYIDEPNCPHYFTTNINQLSYKRTLMLLPGF